MVVRFPQRGEVYWVDFSPARGSEQAGRRPALIVQNDVGNQYAPTTIVAAITSKGSVKVYPTEVILPAGTLPRPSKILCSQILTISKTRLKGRITRLNRELLEQIDWALKRSLFLR